MIHANKYGWSWAVRCLTQRSEVAREHAKRGLYPRFTKRIEEDKGKETLLYSMVKTARSRGGVQSKAGDEKSTKRTTAGERLQDFPNDTTLHGLQKFHKSLSK